MAISGSGTNVGSGEVERLVSASAVWIKANSGTAVVRIDGHEVKISDSTTYQRFPSGHRSFTVVSGNIDYFFEA